jgi:4-amino-4-deoxy-L-arabinose transferase-like glycosyltransferase
MKNTKYTNLIIFAVLLAIGIRVILVWSYAPLYGNDSPSYAALGKMIQTGSFSNYDGRRTPGYPLFMLLLGYNNHLIRLFQHLCGLLSIFIVYKLVRLELPTRSCWPLLILMGLSIQFPFYESIIQTEAPSVLAIMASLYFFSAPTPHPISNLTVASVIASVGALIRPHLIILVPIYIGLYAIQHRYSFRRIITGGVSLALPFVILVGGWVGFNYITISRVTFTTLPKADLIAHMIHYVSDADDKYGEVKYAFKEAFAVERERVEMADDNRAGYTSYAGQLLRERGITNKLELADTIHSMAIDLIKKHPLVYLEEVLSAWLRFWRVHIIIYAECFPKDSFLYDIALLLWLPIKCIWLVINSIFVIFIPFYLFLKMTPERRRLLTAIYCLLLGASASQALTQYYDNARFAVPFQPLVGIAVAIIFATIIESFKTLRTNGCTTTAHKVRRG